MRFFKPKFNASIPVGGHGGHIHDPDPQDLAHLHDSLIWQQASAFGKIVFSAGNSKYMDDPFLKEKILYAAHRLPVHIMDAFTENEEGHFALHLCAAQGTLAEAQKNLETCLKRGIINELVFEQSKELAKDLREEIGLLLDSEDSELIRSA